MIAIAPESVVEAEAPWQYSYRMIRHIVWDWNGTLIDDVPACVRSLNDMLRKYGRKVVTCRQYRRHFGFPVQDYYVGLGFDFSRENWNTVAAEFHKSYSGHSKAVRLRKGARTTLQHLHENGVAMSILSASEISILETMVKERGIRPLFSGLYGLSDLFARSKMDAGRKLLAGINLDPAEILLVGDTAHDSEVASNMGCRCVLVRGGHQAEHRLHACGREILPSVGHVLTYLKKHAKLDRTT
ncbi:MAG: HAD family hydrolase [bacterium]